MAKTEERMTEGPIGRKMIRFAIPLFLGQLFQQLYNVADTLIVGNMLGSRALAAVSSTGSLIFMVISLFAGTAMGNGVLISKYFGARDIVRMRKAVHTSVAFGLVTAMMITVLGVFFTPYVLVWMDTPAEVMRESVLYLRCYFAGALGLVMFNAGMGIMQAVGDSRHPLQYLITAACVNVVLDLLMIGVFRMGVEGAGLATALSQVISAVLCFRRLLTVNADYRVVVREIRFHKEELKLVLKYGLPSGLQNSIIAFANVIVQSNINYFGEMAMAGCGAYFKVEGFGFLPVTSFTQALTTYVSQNLGAKEYDRAKKGAAFGTISAVLIAEVIGVIIVLFAPSIMRGFTDAPEAIAYGVQRCYTVAFFYCLLAYSHCISAVLRGAGKAMVPMIVMLVFWCIIRVAFLAILTPIVQSIAVVNWVYPFTWTLSGIVFTIYILKADWIHGLEKQAKK